MKNVPVVDNMLASQDSTCVNLHFSSKTFPALSVIFTGGKSSYTYTDKIWQAATTHNWNYRH